MLIAGLYKWEGLIILRSHARALVTECMNPVVVYLGVLGIFILGAFLIRNTSIRIRVGAPEYERKRRRRSVGTILMLSAVFCAGIVALSQYFSSNTLAINSPPTSSSTGQPQIASVPLPPRQAIPLASIAAPMIPPPTSSSHDQPPAGPVALLLSQAFQLSEQNQPDAALDKVNAAIQAAPQNPAAYGLRGNIYAEKKLWYQAGKDFQSALQLDGKNTQVKFNLAEIDFMQQKYEDSRHGFVVLKQDPDMGDLATYKVFLCDLFGARDEVAANELDAFNQVGSNASYYFANAAWSLVHHKTEDARRWLTSAANIYAPNKFKLYATSLVALGYMPLPPPPPQ
jgi:Tfp pilus assembly protein PilF